MAEILTKLGHQSTLEVQFRSGDPLYVAEDGHPWGRCESKQQWIAEGLGEHNFPGKFLIIRVPKIPAASVQKFISEHKDGVRLRDHTISLSGVDTGYGFVVADFDQLKASFRNKSTGLPADIKA